MRIGEITPDKNKFIEQIKIGIEILIKLVILDRIKSPERYSTLRSHHKKKSLTQTFLIHELIKKSENKKKIYLLDQLK